MKESRRRCWKDKVARLFRCSLAQTLLRRFTRRKFRRRDDSEWLRLAMSDSEDEENGIQLDSFCNDDSGGGAGGVVYMNSVFGDELRTKRNNRSATPPAQSSVQLVKIADGPVEGSELVQTLDKRTLDRLHKMLGEDENAEAIKTALHELVQAEKASQLEAVLSSLRPELLRTVQDRFKNEAKVREAIEATTMLQHTNAFMEKILNRTRAEKPARTEAEDEEEEEEDEEEPPVNIGQGKQNEERKQLLA